MNKISFGLPVIIVLILVASGALLVWFMTGDDNLFSPNQTSASLYEKFARQQVEDASARDKPSSQLKYLLIYDMYIKARSYAILNKVFFWASVAFGFMVLIWPSLSVIFKDHLTRWEWIKSATVQTTVTGLAALMFTFYSQYKDKQTYTEALMRWVVFSSEPVAELSVKVTEELNKIDRGFSFSTAVGKAESQP
ncbi:MAG: hypothetical protein KDI36_04145 [Pseudomonadales bacterium]|nr:hypothetical protein [Pseudomonadales bacterium]